MPKLGIFKSKNKTTAASTSTDPTSTSHASGPASSSSQLERLSLESPLLSEPPPSTIATLDRSEVHTTPSDKGLSLGGFYHAYTVSRIVLRERHQVEQDDDPRQVLADTSSHQEQGYYSIKVLSKKTIKKLQTADPKLLLQLQTNLRIEANYLAKFQHDHIWTVEGRNDTSCEAFVITHRIVETLEGRLEQWQEEDPESHAVDPHCPSFGVKLEYARQMLSAMQYLHQRNIVGLGFTPASFGFLALQPNQLLLCDLGTCREMSVFSGGHNNSKKFHNSWNNSGTISMGDENDSHDDLEDGLKFEDDEIGDGERFAVMEANTLKAEHGLLVPLVETGVIPRYLAPEIVTRGTEAVTLQADVYTWSMIFVELITLQKPYHGFKGGQHTVKVCMEGKRPNLSMYPHLPQSMEAVLRRCWRHSEDKRWNSTRAIEAVEKVMAKHIQPTAEEPETIVQPTDSMPLPTTKMRRASSSDMTGILGIGGTRRKSLLSKSKGMLRSLSMRDFDSPQVDAEPQKPAMKRSSIKRTSSDKRLLTTVAENNNEASRLPRRTKSGDKTLQVTKSFDTGVAEATMDASGSQTKRHSGHKKTKLPSRTQSVEEPANPTKALPRRTRSGRKSLVDEGKTDEATKVSRELDGSPGSEHNHHKSKRPGVASKKHKAPRRSHSGDKKAIKASSANDDGGAEGSPKPPEQEQSQEQISPKRTSVVDSKKKLPSRTHSGRLKKDSAAEGSSETPEQAEMDDSIMSTQSQEQNAPKRSSVVNSKKKLPHRTHSGNRKSKSASAAEGTSETPEIVGMDGSILSTQSQEFEYAKQTKRSSTVNKKKKLPRRTRSGQKESPSADGHVSNDTDANRVRQEDMALNVSSRSNEGDGNEVSPISHDSGHKKRVKRRSLVSKNPKSPHHKRDGLDPDMSNVATESTLEMRAKLEDLKAEHAISHQRKGRVEGSNEHQYARFDTLDKRGDRHRTFGVEEMESTDNQNTSPNAPAHKTPKKIRRTLKKSNSLRLAFDSQKPKQEHAEADPRKAMMKKSTSLLGFGMQPKKASQPSMRRFFGM